MGRKPGPEWEYVSKIKPQGKGQYTCKCKFCGHEWDGGPDRIRGHILGLPGHGVSPCNNAPEIAKEACRRLHAGGKAHGREVFLNAQVDDLDGDTQGVTCSASLGTQASAHASGPSCKKQKVSSKKGSLATAWDLQVRKEATIALRRFFYAEDIPHWKVRSPYFLDMVKAIGKAGPSYVPPTYNRLRTKELQDEVKCIDRELMAIREKWSKYGCSIVCDGWSDTRRRPIINFMACSIHGSIFLKAVDTSGEYKSGEFIFQHLKQVILEVGPSNVVQVCMDNAANCVRAGNLVTEEWPSIFFTRCVCHCLDLLFEDIGKLEWVSLVLEKATKVVTFVTRKSTVLAIFRTLSKKDLVKPAATRFAYSFIMLSNLLDERCSLGLRKLMLDDKFLKMKVSKSEQALEVSEIVYSSSFWQKVKLIVKICAPILKVLRLADREGATMGLIYELTDRMVEKLMNMQDVEKEVMDDIHALCVDRWDMMHTPLHAVGYMLHPVWKGKNQDSDKEVHDGWMTLLKKYTNDDMVLQGELLDELDTFKTEASSFALPIAKEEKRLQLGVKWWETFGACTPKLQALALRVLSQGSCASPCERNWSTFSLIHTQRRNRLLPAHTEKLVYIHTNLRLISKVKERGFERIETTLDMLTKEKDDERLIALQDLQEAIANEDLDDHASPSSHDAMCSYDDDDEEAEEEEPPLDMHDEDDASIDES